MNNPNSCKLLNLPKSHNEVEILSPKQAIFDSLAAVRYTPEGSIGHQARITVTVTVSAETFVPLSARKFIRFPKTMEMSIATSQ